MQALYALTQAEEASVNMVKDDLREFFMPDLNSMEPQNREELSKKRKDASERFIKKLLKVEADKPSDWSDVDSAVTDAFVDLGNRKEKELKTILNDALRSLDGISGQLLLSLLSLDEIYRLAANAQADERPHKSVRGLDLSNIVANPILKMLNESEVLERETAQQQVKLGLLRDELKRIWHKVVATDERFLEYLKGEPDFEAHRDFAMVLFRSILFKDENWQSHFAERDLYWPSNASVVRSLVSKMLKGMEETESDILLPDLSPNWEDDREFFVTLYKKAARLSDEQLGMIAKRIRNWDVERLSQLDRLILQLALAEMINFPNIPVKVTINEYLEICKTYSTPKSRQFVNGILDVLANNLIEEGVIRKSGRGLIDNK